MIAGGDLPDIFMGDMGVDFTPAQLLFYGQQGIFIPLNDLIAQHAPRMPKIFADYPTVADIITAPDGNIYSMPDINDCYHCQGSCKLWINKVWLDKLGLAVPQTIDEFEAALKAFKEMDPNGNGQADELGLVSGAGDQVWTGVVSANNGRSNGSIDNFFMGSFLYNPGEPWLVLNEGKVDVTFNKPGWREGLKYLNRLYAGGLIAPEIVLPERRGAEADGRQPGRDHHRRGAGRMVGRLPDGRPDDRRGAMGGVRHGAAADGAGRNPGGRMESLRRRIRERPVRRHQCLRATRDRRGMGGCPVRAGDALAWLPRGPWRALALG